MDEIITPVSAETHRVKEVQRYKPAKSVAGGAEEKSDKAAENQQSRKENKVIKAGELAEKANRRVRLFTTKIEFLYDSEHQRSIIIVKDKETGEVIRQIPPKEMASLMEKMDEIEGIIFNRSI
jgi:flagellar protein FlaG